MQITNGYYIGDVATNLQNQINQLKKFDESVLTSYTKDLMELPSDATPDDAFLALYVGVGQYLVKVKLLNPDGTPAVGYTIGGLNALLNRSLVTDSSGMMSGIATSMTPTLTVASNYVDIPSISQQITTTGTVTNVTLQFQAEENKIFTYASSTSGVKYSPFVKNIDICAIGGGGGAGGPVTSVHTMFGGCGGNGGEIVNIYGANYNTEVLSVTVGGGGSAGLPVLLQTNYSTVNVTSNAGNSGGSSSVSLNALTLVTARGGSGGCAMDMTSRAVYSEAWCHYYYAALVVGSRIGAEGGHGPENTYHNINNVVTLYGTDENYDGAVSGSYAVSNGSNGSISDVYPFGETSFGNYADGGGASNASIRYIITAPYQNVYTKNYKWYNSNCGMSPIRRNSAEYVTASSGTGSATSASTNYTRSIPNAKNQNIGGGGNAYCTIDMCTSEGEISRAYNIDDYSNAAGNSGVVMIRLHY